MLRCQHSCMASSDFMQRLASHFEAGRLDSESFEAIKSFEQPEPTSLVIGSVMPPGTKEPEVEMNHPGIKDHAMRFALGSAAATGATMVLFGVGFLCMLLSGEVVSEEILLVIGFGMTAVAAMYSFKFQFEGKAEIFINEARVILVGVGGLISWMSVMWWMDISHLETFGPHNVGFWLPLLVIVVFTTHLARRVEARLTYVASWIMWFFPFAQAINQPNDGSIFICCSLIFLVLLREIFMEWYDENRKASMGVQAMFHVFTASIFVWFLFFFFVDATNLGDDEAGMYYFTFFLLVWVVLKEQHSKHFESRYYPGTSLNKAWFGLPALFVFFTGLPLAAAFSWVDYFDLENIKTIAGTIEISWFIASAVNILLGLQMYCWNFNPSSFKTSLTQPAGFTGGLFFTMAFVWFIFGISIWLEDLAVFVFLPLGILVLFMGTKKLVDSGAKDFQTLEIHDDGAVLEEA